MLAGGIYKSANPSFTARELAYQIRDSQPRFVLAAKDLVGCAVQAAKSAGLPAQSVFAFEDVSAQSFDKPVRPSEASLENSGVESWTKLIASVDVGERFQWNDLTTPELAQRTALLIYSSGTTGLPKGVEVSHYNIVANMIQIAQVFDLESRQPSQTSSKRALAVLPMYHGLGLVYYGLVAPKVRLPVVLMKRFRLPQFLENIERFQITDLLLVPPIVVAMAKSPCVRNYNISSVRRVLAGAAPLGMEATTLFERLWPPGLPKLRQAWGMSE